MRTVFISIFRPWDVAQIVPRDRISSSETFEGVLKGMKALLYVLLIIGVWLCAMCSQGSLLLLTSALIKVQLFTVVILDFKKCIDKAIFLHFLSEHGTVNKFCLQYFETYT